MTHTPGEWHTNSGQVYSLDETRGATIALVSDHHGPDVQQANARLIAAAPDLLAALTEIIYQIDQGGSGGKVFARDYCITAARAAIAEVAGRRTDIMTKQEWKNLWRRASNTADTATEKDKPAAIAAANAIFDEAIEAIEAINAIEAAAPDLLAALTETVASLDYWFARLGDPEGSNSLMMKKARAAIAKAKG